MIKFAAAILAPLILIGCTTTLPDPCPVRMEMYYDSSNGGKCEAETQCAVCLDAGKKT